MPRTKLKIWNEKFWMWQQHFKWLKEKMKTYELKSHILKTQSMLSKWCTASTFKNLWLLKVFLTLLDFRASLTCHLVPPFHWNFLSKIYTLIHLNHRLQIKRSKALNLKDNPLISINSNITQLLNLQFQRWSNSILTLFLVIPILL